MRSRGIPTARRGLTRADAAFLFKEGNRLVYSIKAGPTQHCPTLFLLTYQSGGDKPAKVEGERRSGNGEPRLDIADRQTLRPRLDQKAQNVELRAVAKLREDLGGFVSFHSATMAPRRRECNYLSSFIAI